MQTCNVQEVTVNYCTAILRLHLDNTSTRSMLLAIELCWVFLLGNLLFFNMLSMEAAGFGFVFSKNKG